MMMALRENGQRSTTVIAQAGAAQPTEPPTVLLIRGCPRTGTTLLVNVLNQNGDIGIFNEYALGDLIGDLTPIFAFEREQRKSERVASRAAGSVGSDALPNVYIHPFENAFVRHCLRFPSRERLAAIVTGIVATSLEKRDLRIIGSKTPGGLENNDRARVADVFPRVKYLFTVRNPLDTINSIVNRRNRARLGWDSWAFETVEAAIREYRESMALLCAIVTAYPDDCFVVGYEDLVHDFAATAQQLGDFLGVALACDPRIVQCEQHRKLVLDPEEERKVRAELEPVIRGWGTRRLTGPGRQVLDAVADCIERLEPGTEQRYGAASPARRFLGLGWDEVESQGIWSNAETADLLFRAARDGEYMLRLNLSFFLPAVDSTVSLAIDVNGHDVFRSVFYHTDRPVIDATATGLSLYPGRGNTDVWCGPVHLSAGAPNRVRLRFGAVRSPSEQGIDTDARKLAVALHAIALQEAPARAVAAGGAKERARAV